MFVALTKKELRDVWWMGLLATVWLMLHLLGGYRISWGQVWQAIRGLPAEPIREHAFEALLEFPGRIRFASTMFVCSAAMALWQTVGESLQGTWSGLLYRPVSRQQIVLAKLLAGLLVLVTATGTPLLGLWLFARNTGYLGPWDDWMIRELLNTWLVCLLFYPAFLHCGIRRGRWWGSRLWPPMAAAGVWYLWEETLAGSMLLWLLLVASGLLIWSLVVTEECVNQDFA